jgi:cytochrome c oxidase subunit 2
LLTLLACVALAGCAPLYGPLSTFVLDSDFARASYSLFRYTFIWDVLILLTVLVPVVLALFVLTPRKSGGEHEGEDHQGSAGWLEAAWTIAPALILVSMAVPSIRLTFEYQPKSPPAGALHVRVIGHQWWWEFQYPDSHLTIADELHIPAGRPVYFDLESADVLHGFWAPQLGGKRDTIPGHVNHLLFTPDKPGEYFGECTQYCGLSHANMRFRIFVDTPEKFAAWVKQQQASPATGGSDPKIEAGASVFAAAPCVACHTIDGVSKGYIGPNLSHIGSHQTLAGSILPNTPENMAKWIHNPEALKPGAQMPALGLDPAQTSALVAYLESLK